MLKLKEAAHSFAAEVDRRTRPSGSPARREDNAVIPASFQFTQPNRIAKTQ
jgi:hypothetical protein